MSLKLLIICSIAAFALSIVNAVTAPEIKRLEEESKSKALSGLIETGFADSNREIVVLDNEFVSSYYLITDGDSTIGYILYIKAKGYGGSMTLMASYRLDGSVINSILMANQETPGFGKKAEKDGYMDKFKNLGSDNDKLPLFGYEAKEEVDTITGATITFMGVSKAIKMGSDFVKGDLK